MNGRVPSVGDGPGSSLGQESPRHVPALPFFVVGVGASAGGLEALSDLFSHVDLDSNLSFVVIVHLSPDFKSMMAELLSRHTRLRVVEIEEGGTPAPSCVHVIAPNRLVTLENGVFLSVDRELRRGTLPLDVFLASLARDQGDQSAAIILSGTGTDGTHGLRLVKEAGGLVMAQEPGSATFGGMPESAIGSGSVDFVGTPAQLAERLQSYVQSLVERMVGPDVAGEREAFEEILRLLRQQSRIQFSMYKEATVMRRIQRRASLVGERTLGGYLQALRGKPPEVEQLTRELLIGVTQFFRDPAAWGYLEDNILPPLLAIAEDRGLLRLWVAGCATGEEAYTLAMLLEEQLQKARRPMAYRLFATDVRRDSLRYARAGVYPRAACLAIPELLRERYFEASGDHLVVKRALRDAVTFAPHDLLADPPFTQLNLVVCRNLLIYVDGEAQRHVLSRFRGSLKEGGFLFLGASESVAESNPQFRTLSARANVYVARGAVSGTSLVVPGVRGTAADLSLGATPAPRPSRSTEALYEAAIQRYVPPGVAVDSNFELLQVFGRALEFMTMPPGRVTISLLKMVPRSLSVLLSSAGRKALSQGEEITIPEVRVPGPGGEQSLCVRIVPVDDLPGVALGLMIFFESPRAQSGAPLDRQSLEGAVDQRLRALEDELLVAREHLSAAVQDLEASNEELQTTNEELTASNEELQSTNEELQSVNEELYTANSEYQEKIGELVEINADLENLLRVVDAGVLFLDESLTIRRFNDSATRLFPLRYEDLGRPLGEIALQAEYKLLAEDAQDVLRTGARKLTTVLGHDGAWWSIGVRPAGDRIGSPGGGVIVTMQEISELKRAISELSRYRHAHEMAESASGIGHAVLDLTSGVVHYSEGARHLFGFGDAQPPIEESLALFATETSRTSVEMLESLRLETGLPFTTERELSVAAGERVRLQLSVQAKLDPASGEKLVFAVFQASQPAP